jgi:hypothetical protein
VVGELEGAVGVWPNVGVGAEVGCPKVEAVLLEVPKGDVCPNAGPDDAPKALGLPKAELVEVEFTAPNAD